MHRPSLRARLATDDHPAQPATQPQPQVQLTEQGLTAGEPHDPHSGDRELVQADFGPLRRLHRHPSHRFGSVRDSITCSTADTGP